MNKQFDAEKERLKKINDTFLYNFGYEHVNNICDETDKLLEKYKDIEVPDSLNQWFVDYNDELEKKERYRKIRIKALKFSKRIAVVLIIISFAGSVMTMSVEAFRVRFFNLVIETSQKFSMVTQEEINGNYMTFELPSDWINYYYPSYLPEGYSLISTRTLVDTKYMIFGDLEGQELRFIQGNSSSKSQIDSENGSVIEVDINGSEGVIAIKDDMSILYWSKNDMSFSIQGNVGESILLAIAESIEKNK